METSDDKRGVNMRVERTNSDELLVDKLPDGSKFIVDPKNETVFALNATAGAAWDACGAPTTLSGALDPPLSKVGAEAETAAASTP